VAELAGAWPPYDSMKHEEILFNPNLNQKFRGI
jgi:hypothetical protein